MEAAGINKIKNDLQITAWQARINNPDLDPSDSELIQRFSRGEISKKELLNRYSLLADGMVDNYDGKVNIENSRTAKRTYAFEWALDSLVEKKKISRMEIASAGEAIFLKYLKPEDKQLLIEYRRSASRPLPEWEKARHAILNRIFSYQEMLDGAEWGTRSKIESYQRYMALKNVVQGSIPEDEIRIVAYMKGLGFNGEPPEGKQEYKDWIGWKDYLQNNILPIEKAIRSPEGMSDQQIRSQIIQYFMLSYTNYLLYLRAKDLDAKLIDQASTMVEMFLGFANEMGISREELDAKKSIIEDTISKPDIKQVNLQEIKRPTVVTPDTLPRAVIRFLEKVEINGVSGYQFVKENVKYIILNPQIHSSGNEAVTGGEGPLGVASGFLQVIEIDVYNEDKNAPRTALELVNTIMHETFHVHWMRKHFNQPKMVSSAINEGLAFLAGAKVSEQLLEKLFPDPKQDKNLGPRSIENKNIIENDIEIDMAAVGGAIQEFGLDPAKALKGIDIPGFLRAYQKGNHENDIETYPTFTPYYMTQYYLTLLDVKGEERARLRPIFEGIIKGGAFLSLDRNERSIIHALLAKIDPRYRAMKYEEAITELRKLYGYYTWKETRFQYESDIRLLRAQYKGISIKDIENRENRYRMPVKEAIREVLSGKRDNLIIGVLAKLYTAHKKR